MAARAVEGLNIALAVGTPSSSTAEMEIEQIMVKQCRFEIF